MVTRRYTARGETHTLSEWVTIGLPVCESTVRKRIADGWSDESALFYHPLPGRPPSGGSRVTVDLGALVESVDVYRGKMLSRSVAVVELVRIGLESCE